MAAPDGPLLDLGRLIAALERHEVDYLLCGGAAAAAYGAGRPTEDADCVVSRERGNVDRLAEAMRELNARLRVTGMTDEEATALPVQIDGATLADLSVSTWMTDAGPFDVLAGLEDRAKEHADRPKDREALPELRAIRDGTGIDKRADPG